MPENVYRITKNARGSVVAVTGGRGDCSAGARGGTFRGTCHALEKEATHSIPFCMSKQVDMSSPMTGRRNLMLFSH